MATSYKLPKITADTVVVLNTPVAGDTVLANGVLTVLDDAGNVALKVKAADFLSYDYDAAAAGTANEINFDLAGVTVVANTTYAVSIYGPYAQNFFGGGKETGAVYTTRTYEVSLPASPAPTTALLSAAFTARINADVNAYFTATDNGTDFNVLADSVLAGSLVATAPLGAVISDVTPWVAPVGTTTEVLAQVNNAALVVGTAYDRYVLNFRKPINNNIVNGLKVIKDAKLVIYIDSADAGAAAAVTLIGSIFAGTETAADYLGCPAV